MTRGTAGVAGDRPNHFNGANDVLVERHGDIFVPEDHSDNGFSNDRIARHERFR